MPICEVTAQTLIGRRPQCQLCGSSLPHTGTLASGLGPAFGRPAAAVHHQEVAKKAQQKTATTGRQAILRIPGIATLAVAVLTVCVTPAAFAVPGLQALYLVPIALFVWILRTRTVADARGLTVRTVFGQRELPWSELKGLSLSKRGKVSAVTTAGEEVALPTVRTRHLPVLSLVSEGRVGDPTGLTEDMDTTSESPSTGQE